SPDQVVRDIDRALDEIVQHPRRAKQRATQARLIFERRFAAEAMLENAVAYYEEWRQKGGKPTSPEAAPMIDVIVRVGGRPVSTILRAVRSIDNQTAGRFRVIFVRYRDVDLDEIVIADWQRIRQFDILDDSG